MASEITQIMNGMNVVNAVCMMITEYFNTSRTGSAYTLYKEAVPQKMKTPCFFVKLDASYVEKLMNVNRRKIHNITVHYFPADTTKKPEEECHIVEDCLYECLDDVNITVLKAINHDEQSYETTIIPTHTEFTDSRIVDNVLIFSIIIRSNFVRVPVFPSFMGELEGYVNLNGNHDLTSNTVIFDVEE